MKDLNFIFYKQEEDSLLNLLRDIYLLKDKAIDSNEFKYISYDNDHTDVNSLFFAFLNGLVTFGVKHGFYGNLWHCYITYLCVYHENAYSMDCEMIGAVGGTMDNIARNDFAILQEWFNFDLIEFSKDFDIDITNIIDFSDGGHKEKYFNTRIRDCICQLSKDLEKAENPDEFQSLMVDFYKHFGVGKFGLHKAFRLSPEGDITPISRIRHVSLDDLVGLEIQKKKLVDNTEAFVKGKNANNCMLFGDAGTGKSTSIKAIANEYYDDGLRIIEVYKHEFKYLNKIISEIKNRNYKFIIYMDDLSFEEFEVEYKYLKAVIEGGLEKKPANVLIYATSNRRHFVKESMLDNQERMDLHSNDSKQEKISLSSRFGVSIYFGAPTPKEFQQIVLTLKERNGIDMDDDEILMEANAWQMHHNGFSGRTAQQFIDYLMGQE